MSLPSRLRLLRLMRRPRLRIAAFALLAAAALAWWLQPDRVDPAALLAQQPTAAGRATEPPLWPLDAEGQLQPHRALRERFDQLLAQAPPPAARALLAQQASAELRPEQAEAVLRLWDAYLALQQQDWQVPVDLNRPETWAEALAERHAARREQLGSEWALAFYGADEARVRAFLAERGSAQPSP
jgi:hypothetical protein